MSTEKIKFFDADEARSKSDMYTRKKVNELIDDIFTYGIIDAVNRGEYSCQFAIDHTKYPQNVRYKAMEELKGMGYDVGFLTRTNTNDPKHESYTDKTKMEIKWNKMKNSNEFKTKYEDMPEVSVLGDGRYNGIMSGYCFTYKGVDYHTSFGIRGISQNVWIEIQDGKDRLIR